MLNGRLFADIDGNITCISNDRKSIVDYIIASSSLFDKFSSFAVDNYEVSDHFPLISTLKLIRRNNMRHDTISTELGDWQKFKWKEFLKDDFLHKFHFYYSEFRKLMVNNEYNLSHYLPDFINVFQSASDLMRVKLKQPRYFMNKVCQPYGGILPAVRQNLRNKVHYENLERLLLGKILHRIKFNEAVLRLCVN